MNICRWQRLFVPDIVTGNDAEHGAGYPFPVQ